MDLGGVVQRHRVAIASYLALALAVAAVVVYAVAAQGYRAHQTRLNDGGIWVSNNADSFFGRMNKPIGQLDGAIFGGLNSNLDVAQDDSAVVGVNLSAGTIAALDPSTMHQSQGSAVPIPSAPEVQADGGTLGVVDTAKGNVWATRVDTVAGVPDLTQVSRSAKPLFKVGAKAALAVSDSGTVVAVSAATGNLLSVSPAATAKGFGAIHKQRLTAAAGARSLDLTTVGETPVVLDPATGTLGVVGGPTAKVPVGSVLQQPGADTTTVLVDAPTALLAVDLSSGAVTTLADHVHGRPARPVRLGDCRYGAWSGGTGYVATRCAGGDPMVAGLRTQTSDLVFRVNRGQIVLNDRSTGAVWNVDRRQPERLDNWDAYRAAPTKTDHQQHNDHPSLGDRRPPKAKDDHFGARPGRATVLHPLDNDSAPQGRLLAIRSIPTSTISDPKAKVRISPDGQTVAITLPPNATGETTFVYYVDDGRDGVSGHATVHVQARLGSVNQPPAPRLGTKPRIWNIPASGTMTVPALADWRDYRDGDAISLVSAHPESGTADGARATVTDGGGIRFQAPDTAGLVRVRYTATDSLSPPVARTMTFRVEGLKDDHTFPAVAEPDVVVGEAGQPITIKPLLNDLPGSDPFDPQAQLELAGRVAQPAGASVSTDLQKGTITLQSSAAHTYFLDYQAAYGNAKAAGGRIRVDVRTPQKDPQDPVAMPDQVTLYGQAPSLVDVLANDSDPAGGLLEVQGASAADPTQLDVGVVDGRWLRISAPRGAISPDPQVVTYQISDGPRSGITGQVVVDQRPEPADDTPVTTDDEATVRSGNALSIPALDNDLSPSGDQLDLVTSVEGQRPGQLQVVNPGGGPTGTAYVVGRQVRYVAPTHVADTQNVQISYVAVNSQGLTAPGTIDVTVSPRSKSNDPPEPPVLEGRVVSGDVVKLRLPGSGVDPDGDSVTILGLDTAPALGRVTHIGANSIDYQAYPDSVGTDEFSYQLTDSMGARATGKVRIVVAPPETPQAPLAVADTMNIAPGRTASVNVLANDLVSSGDRVTVSLVSPPPGVTLASPVGPVDIQAPRVADGRNEVVVYRISNGIDISQATITLTVVPGYNNPPVVSDAYGSTGNGDTVITDVLSNAYDPDGPFSGLRISRVVPPPGVKARVVQGSKIRVSRGKDPIVVPFVVSDRDGGSTTGNLYVPAATGGRPYVKPGALIKIAPDGSYSGRLSSFVVNPSGGPVRFTAANRVWTSPQPGLDVAVSGNNAFRIDAAKRYTGPGAMVFEVTTATGRNAQNSKKGTKVVLTIPVQVGANKPVLRCPSNSLDVVQGEQITVDVLSLCHVWTIEAGQASRLSYSASWDHGSSGLSLGAFNGSRVVVSAARDASAGSTAVLDVSASGSDPGQVRIHITKASPTTSPPPRMIPIKVSDLRYGDTRTVDLTPYLIPGVKNPQPAVVSATQTSGVPVRITASGASVTLRALRHANGHATFRIVMSDAGRSAPPARRVQGVLSLDILDVPGAPGRPLPDAQPHNARVPMTYTPAAANGAPITGYEVKSNQGRTMPCGSTSCTFTGLTNGTTYRFAVRARNAVGWGPWSSYSRPAIPDAQAGQVRAVRMTANGDHFISLAWDRPLTTGSQVTSYKITWRGAGRVVTSQTEAATITGLNNDDAYRFTIIPINRVGAGLHYVSRAFRPIGTPSPPGKPNVQDIPQDGDTAQVAISWSPVDPNGPPDVRYDVYRDSTLVCNKIQATSCTDQGMPYDGTTYSYTVESTNKHGVGLTSGPSVATTYQAVGTPASWANGWTVTPTGSNQQVQVAYTVPNSHGKASKVDILVSGQVTQSYNETGTVSHVISVPSDDAAYPISLRVCNEYNRCTTTAGAQTVQAYGPLNDGNLNVAASQNGAAVTYEIFGDSNGRPASVTVTHDNPNCQQQTWSEGPGQFHESQTCTVGYNQTDNILVTISDPQVSRGVGNAHFRGQAGGPPQPTLSISRGGLCNDGDSDPNNNCNNTGIPPLDCADPTCGWVVLTLGGWVDAQGNPAPATCQVAGATSPGKNDWTLSNGATELDYSTGHAAYAGNPAVVTAHCSDDLGQQADATFQWPTS